jgi:hypothetical protein
MRRLLAVVAVLALGALPAGSALAHGGEEEALENTPARALAQQALALLSQRDKVVEAHERIEAALKSKNRAGVDLALLRQTQRAFDRGDHAEARRLINRALMPKREPPEEEMGGGHESEDPSAPTQEDGEAALEHQPSFEPERDTADWIGAALGAAVLLLAGTLLLRRRRHA